MEDRKQKEAQFHDRLRGVYERHPEQYGGFLTNKKYYDVTGRSRDFLRDWLTQNCRGKNVLDFGCGSGDLSFMVLPVAGSLTGIDISQDSVDHCRWRAEEQGFGDRARFEVMDCENTSFDDSAFDVICESGVLHHLDADAAFREMARLLRPDGKVICHEALRHNPVIAAYRRRTPHLRTEWETDHILGEPEIDQAGRYFGRVRKRFFHLAGLAAVPFRSRRSFPGVLKALDRIDEHLLKVPLVRRQAWICVFELSDPVR